MTLWDIYEKSTVFKNTKGGKRKQRSASLFVCGILLRELLCPEIAFLQEMLPKENGGYTLEEIWYMLCLHHDKDFEKMKVREKGKTRGNATRCEKSMEEMRPYFQYAGEGICFTNGVRIRECLLSEEEIEDLYYFRRACYKKEGTDHGVTGGLLLFENLIRRYPGNYEKADRTIKNLYSYAANTLLIHNLCAEHMTKGRISPQTDPLLFLLLVSEVIEPLQYGKDGINTEKLLQSVQVAAKENELILRPEESVFNISAMVYRMGEISRKTEAENVVWQNSSEISVSW